MNITRERLSEIALKVAGETYKSPAFTLGVHNAYLKDFTYALLKAVEAECEVVGYRFSKGPITKLDIWKRGGAWKPLITLPLVKEEL